MTVVFQMSFRCNLKATTTVSERWSMHGPMLLPLSRGISISSMVINRLERQFDSMKAWVDWVTKQGVDVKTGAAGSLPSILVTGLHWMDRVH